MKAIISSTYNDTYLFFLPIVTFCWNKLGVDVICFMPKVDYRGDDKLHLTTRYAQSVNIKISFHFFSCPEYKQATYSQCSRLYAAALDLPDDEILITSDVDMGVFMPPTAHNWSGDFSVAGYDLTPDNQYPMCYVSGPRRRWAKYFNTDRGYQKCLDDLLGHIECESFRGNYWGKDQEELFNNLQNANKVLIQRARPGTQFAANRVDRDDINWRSYCGPDLIDAHLWRPGYTDENFANILELLHTQYPSDNFDWLKQYREQYISLL